MPKGYPKSEEAREKQLETLRKHAFKKGNKIPAEGRGRRPLTITCFINEMKQEGYEIVSRAQVVETFLYISTLPEKKLVEILSDKERPMMVRILAKGILDKKGMDILERIIDRAFGRVQQVDITSKGEQIKQQDPIQMHFVANSEEYQKVLAEIKKEKET